MELKNMTNAELEAMSNAYDNLPAKGNNLIAGLAVVNEILERLLIDNLLEEFAAK